ncbi:MAG: HAD family phosphatase [Candidatus Methylacidiphilales bacterium]|nr:HAD family phosphatase [Candidatus Methylacidiphilales bacterium]
MEHRWAALFDWDGVIVDSSRAHRISWEQLALEEERVLPEDHFERSFGMKNARIIPELLEWSREPAEIKRLSNRKEALYREIIREEGIEALPGVGALLGSLRDAGVPCVVGSSTDRENIVTILGMLGLRNAFDGMVTSEDVTLGKPHPEVFLKAAALAGVEPGRCVVFEDAPVGIQAARAADMKVVALASSHPRERLEGADRVVAHLGEVDLTMLLGLWPGEL